MTFIHGITTIYVQPGSCYLSKRNSLAQPTATKENQTPTASVTYVYWALTCLLYLTTRHSLFIAESGLIPGFPENFTVTCQPETVDPNPCSPRHSFPQFIALTSGESNNSFESSSFYLPRTNDDCFLLFKSIISTQARTSLATTINRFKDT